MLGIVVNYEVLVNLLSLTLIALPQ